jgi:hypothetical protein
VIKNDPLCLNISKKIQKHLEQYTSNLIEENQAGSVKGRSTMDQIFIIKNRLEIDFECNKEAYRIFIDFSKAYDSLNRVEIWEKMKKFRTPCKLNNLVRLTMQGSKFKVKIDGSMSESFEVKTGIRQGDIISPILFNIAIKDALQTVRRTNKVNFYV